MVLRAQADQVPGVSRAAVFPVDDVVDLDESVGGAAWHAAAAVAAFDEQGALRKHMAVFVNGEPRKATVDWLRSLIALNAPPAKVRRVK